MKTVGIISVPVTDQQKSKEFYLRMGLTLANETPMGNGQTWVQLAFPEGYVNIALVTWFPKMPAGSLHGVTILTDNIQQEKERLQHAGIETGKTDETPWGKFAFLTDPDGNSWILHEK